MVMITNPVEMIREKGGGRGEGGALESTCNWEITEELTHFPTVLQV